MIATNAAATTTSKLWSMSLIELAHLLKNGEVTSVAVTEACLERITETKSLNTFVSVTSDLALTLASASDARRKAGSSLGILDGIPFAVKDNFAMSEGDVHTTCGSKMLSNYRSPFTATVVERLLALGGVVVGKTNMDEFGMGSTGIHSMYGPTLNPLDTTRVSGGSSGGSAAAVASGCCYAALGSDTGGSVRLPASFCGVVGFKPSYGRASRHGLIAYASSLDTPGVITRSVADAATVTAAIVGVDERDSTSVTFGAEWKSGYKMEGILPLRVGVPRQCVVEELAPELLDIWRKTLQTLHDDKVEIVPVSLPTLSAALAAYYVLASAEASSNLSRYNGILYGNCANDTSSSDIDIRAVAVENRRAGLGEEVQRRVAAGTFALMRRSFDSYYGKAQRVRQLLKKDFEVAFSSVDVMILPTAAGVAPTLAEARQTIGVESYVNDVFTVPISLAGLPAISLPVWSKQENDNRDRGRRLPYGLQIVSPHMQDERLLSVAESVSHLLNQQQSELRSTTHDP